MSEKQAEYPGELGTVLPCEPLLRDSLLVVPLALPVALLALDSSWIYSLPFRDPWIYYGLFLYPEELTRELGPSYYSARLSVILPGWAAYQLLPTVTANLLLHLGLFWTAVFSFYTVCKLELGRGAALLSTLAMGCHPYFLQAIGSNYVDGFGIAYLLAALLCLALARRAWRTGLVLAGAAAMALVTANIFYALYLPVLAAYHLTTPRSAGRPPPLRRALLAGLGVAGMFTFLGILYQAIGGSFFYLFHSLRFIRWTTLNPHKPFWHPLRSWFGEATWLVLPVAVCLGAVVLLARLRREPDTERRRFLVFSQLQLLAFAAAMGLLQVGARIAVLEHFFYASLLLPPTFLALAGQVAAILRHGVSSRQWAALAGGAAVVFALPWIASLDGPRLKPVLGAPVFLAGLIALGLFLVLWLGATGVRAAVVALGCLAVSQVLAWRLSPFPYAFDGFGVDARTFFEQVAGSVSLVEDHGRPRIWYNLGVPGEGPFYDLVASAFLFCPSMVSADFPQVHEGWMCDGSAVRPGLRIAVLSSEPDAFAKADAALRTLGFSSRFLCRHEVPSPRPGTAFTYLEVKAGGPA